MDRELILEIGCEEIPASWLPALTNQVGEIVVIGVNRANRRGMFAQPGDPCIFLRCQRVGRIVLPVLRDGEIPCLRRKLGAALAGSWLGASLPTTWQERHFSSAISAVASFDVFAASGGDSGVRYGNVFCDAAAK